MLRVLTREGVRPKKKSQPGRSSLLKVQPTDNPGPVGSSQLRGRSDACFPIDMHASIKAGTEWIMYTNDGCYGTDHIPITPQFLLVAFRFTPRGSEEIWSAHSAVAPPKSLSFDPLFYLALSSLPLTYPWPILTIDLKNFLPLMDRHVLTHLVAAQASVNPRFQHPAPVLGSFFKDLAHAVVHTILAPLNSEHMRPNLPPRVFTGEFWHAHFNYAALRTHPALAAIGSMDGLAGDQICQWNSVAPDSILPATHLSIFVPPPLGAFVLANHQNHEDFKSTPASATQSSPIFSVQQNIQFPLPQVFSNQDELLSLSLDYRQQKVTSVKRLSHFLVIPTSQLLSRKCVGRFAFPCHPRQKIPLPAVSLPLLRFDRVLEAAKPSMALSGSPPRLPMLTKILSIYSSRTSLSSPILTASTAKSRAMSTPFLLMNTLFAGCEPRLPSSLNAMKGINLLSHLASMPFSAAISLFLR